MAREGMDVDVITNDGNQMRDVGQNAIPGVISAVESIISQIESTWHGADAQSFVNAWQSTFKPNLTSIAAAVAGHGQLALTNVQAQQAASTATNIS
jgi:uncharacterized protein YukE